MVDLGVDSIESSALLKRHAELEALYGDGDNGRFLSGWQCDNPWSGCLRARIGEVRATLDDSHYQYLDKDSRIVDGFTEFHRAVDGSAPAAIFCGEGSTSLIFTTCALLKMKGINEVFYIPPLYFSAHFAFKLLGIRARPISGRHVFETGFTLNLPDQSTTLFLADPVWYAGISVYQATMERIITWQKTTQSFVFVDGSFQYMRWNGGTVEATAELETERTIRILCPTKALALHGYRFAYAILPQNLRTDFAHAYANFYGSASAESIAFGRTAAELTRPWRITAGLVKLAADRHTNLRSTGKIYADWQPDCGYFVFERLMPETAGSTPLMDGSFFEQRRYPDHRRLNLLSPSIGLLG